MEPIWEKDLEKKPFETKQEEIRTYQKDIVVVGGGIAGFLVAYFLAESGQSVTLIEAERLFGGVTKNTTAHINALQGKYKDIPSRKNRKMYYNAQLLAVDEIERLVKQYKIECDFKRIDSFLFGDKKKLKKEYKVLKQIRNDAEYLENEKFLFGSGDLIKLKKQAIFNPIKFLRGLPIQFEIIENARVLKVNLAKRLLKTKNQLFYANQIVFATNFPVVNIRGLYAFKMYKSISYAVNIKTDKRLNAIYNSILDDGFTYRDSENGIIIGGLDHRTGRNKGCTKFKDLIEGHSSLLGGKWDTKWAANDCITFDGIPYAGRFGLTKNIYLISGFGKWGMTNSVVCARMVSDIINKEKNEYKKLFKPTRILNIKVWFKVLFNALYNVGNICLSVFWGPRCPHMHCRLKFNKNTKTWDCPCHGSRFTANGKIIAEPAAKEISV